MNRRELLELASKMVWTVPVVDAVILPLHAQGSPIPIPPPPTQPPPTLPPEGCPVELRYSGPATVVVIPDTQEQITAYVKQQIHPLLSLVRTSQGDHGSWTANAAYGVVVAQTASAIFITVNVSVGDRIEPENGERIHTFLKYRCVEDV